MDRTFKRLAYDAPGLMFGRSREPLRRRSVVIGNGAVIPEIKFTLPPMEVAAETMPEIARIYAEAVEGVCQRAVDLGQRDLVLEFEHLPPMTEHPEWGEELTALLSERLHTFESGHGLRTLLRVTPVDIREAQKPPLRRTGPEAITLFDSFTRCARAGADLLSIESTGGKEVTDPAIMAGDLRGVLFGMGVLGPADMSFLWRRISEIADGTGTVAAGDTACGIGNTAMMLADQGYIPKVFAAVVRSVTAVRSLVAYEVGAVGPGKDCGYENIFLKAVTGLPMSLEGRTAACAHLSSIGNIAGAYADLWSNESIQAIKLLGGMAPVVSMEQLIYDCRLYNRATERGVSVTFRDLLVESDTHLDPQAYIFRPDHVVTIAKCMVDKTDPLDRSIAVARATIEVLQSGAESGDVAVSDRERPWLDRMRLQIDDIERDQPRFIEEESIRWGNIASLTEYGLPALARA